MIPGETRQVSEEVPVAGVQTVYDTQVCPQACRTFARSLVPLFPHIVHRCQSVL
jgi:hypothetical protein